MKPMVKRLWATLGLGFGAVIILTTGCKRNSGDGTDQMGAAKKVTIRNIGSDTMVNLAQAWAEAYAQVEPTVSIEVSGGGSAVGVAALLNGTAEIANCSRKLDAKEVERAKVNGKNPEEFLVGFDGLAVYVHKSNPISQISLEELSEIYREGGKVNKWADLGINTIPGAKSDNIIRVSRQNTSATYAYFREAVLGKNADFKQGSLDMNGSKDVVELVAETPGAIGYSGLGNATPDVKILPISKKKGDPGVLPSIASVHAKSYPISRGLFVYTPVEPSPQVRKYINWILGDAGQKIVARTGQVPLLEN